MYKEGHRKIMRLITEILFIKLTFYNAVFQLDKTVSIHGSVEKYQVLSSVQQKELIMGLLADQLYENKVHFYKARASELSV